MQKSGLVLLGFVMLAMQALPVQAQRRPDTSAMSCGAARALVQRAGAIVMGSGPNLYDRYVNHRGYCTPSEDIDPAFVRSRDSGGCFIGYTCREIVHDIEP